MFLSKHICYYKWAVYKCNLQIFPKVEERTSWLNKLNLFLLPSQHKPGLNPEARLSKKVTFTCFKGLKSTKRQSGNRRVHVLQGWRGEVGTGEQVEGRSGDGKGGKGISAGPRGGWISGKHSGRMNDQEFGWSCDKAVWTSGSGKFVFRFQTR